MLDKLNELISYLKMVWMRRRIILICTWLVCPIGWLIVSLIPYQYESNARVYVDTQSMLEPLLDGLTVEDNADEKVDLMVKTLLSRKNLERIVRMTDLDLQAATPAQFEAIIEDLQKDFKIKKAKRDNIYTLSIVNRDPQLAKDIVEAGLSVFFDNTLIDNRNDSNEAKRFLTEQIALYKDRLTKAERTIAEFKQKHLYELPSQAGGYYSALSEERNKLEEANLEYQVVTQELEIAKSQLFKNPQAIAFSSSYEERITELQKSYDEMLLIYTEKHPSIIETKSLIADLKQKRQSEIEAFQLSSLESKEQNLNIASQSEVLNGYHAQIAGLESKKAAAKVKVENHSNRVAMLESRIQTMPQVELKLTDLNRDYDVIKSNYEGLLERQETAKIAEDVDQTTDNIRFEVLDPPMVPAKPVKPNRPLLLLAVTFGGIGVGVGIAFLLGQVSPVVIDAKQVKNDLGVNVYGILDATPESNLKAINKRKTIIFIMSNVVVFMITVALVLYTMRETIMLIAGKYI